MPACLHTHTTQQLHEMMAVLTNLNVVIILQYRCISNNHAVHFKLPQYNMHGIANLFSMAQR